MVTSFNIPVVLQSLECRLGWDNPTEAGYGIVDCDNQKSLSQRYFNDDTFHPGCSVQYLYDCQPDADITDVQFNEYLQQLRISNAIDVASMVMNMATNHVEKGVLFGDPERIRFYPVANTGKFVGIMLRLEPEYVVNIPTVMFLFDKDVEFTLYLHNQLKGKVAQWKIKAKANEQYIFPLKRANYENSSLVKGGMWFLSYDQTELGDARAIDIRPVRNIYSCMSAKSFEATRTGEATFDMFNYNESYKMFGMNIEVTNYKDVTQWIVDNAHLFDTLLGLNMASKVLDIIGNTSRSNNKQRITAALKTHFYRENNNVTTSENPFEGGLRNRIKKEAALIQKSYNRIAKSTVEQR